MRTFTDADAKNKFGRLIDLARAAPVTVVKSSAKAQRGGMDASAGCQSIGVDYV